MQAVKADKIFFEERTEPLFFSLFKKGNDYNVFVSPQGQFLILAMPKHGCAPGVINILSLPDLSSQPFVSLELSIENYISIQGITQKIDFSASEKFDGAISFVLTDFPGHIKKDISRFLDNNMNAVQQKTAEALAKFACEALSFSKNRQEHRSSDSSSLLNLLNPSVLTGLLLTSQAFAHADSSLVNLARRIAMETRLFLKYAEKSGKYFLSIALSGQMSEIHQEFFQKMKKDNTVDINDFLEKSLKNPFFGGIDFLMGVLSALNLIEEYIFK